MSGTGPEQFEVRGTVTDTDGQGLVGAEVIVWWQRIRERIELARGETSEQGRYVLRYSRPDDESRVGCIMPNLGWKLARWFSLQDQKIKGLPTQMLIVVEARSRHLDEPIKSPVMRAQPDLQINLEAQPRDRSEYATLLRSIRPLLENLTLLDIVENDQFHDISFLAQESGKSSEQIMCLVIAARLEAAFNIPAATFLEAAFDIPAAAFYAFLRQRVPAALPTPLLEATQGFTLIDPLVRRIGSLIFTLTPDVQKRTLEAAVKQNFVGPQLEPRIPDIVDQLQARRTTEVLAQPYLVGKTTLGELLDTAQLDKSKQDAFAKALIANTQSMRNFWRTLGDGQHGLTAVEASAVQRTLEIGALVGNHLPLVKALLQDFAAGNFKSLSGLAWLSEQHWVQLVDQTGAPVNVDETDGASPVEVFARVIYARVTRAYPTTALASRVANGTFLPEGERSSLKQFFRNNPTLELNKINLASYLNQQVDEAFNGIAAEDRPAVIANAKRIQRVLRTVPDVDTAQTLLGLGIHSATQIATMGQQQFFTKATAAGLTKRQANKVYELSAQRYAGVVSLITRYHRDFIGIWPKALGSTADLNQPIAQAIQRDESLATLFGSQDYCAVDSCTSVLSPAAYLCDLLMWLRGRSQGGHTALDVLIGNASLKIAGRRPDIGHLLLNCFNTNTPLPYIDLVNELLEDAVSPPQTPIWRQTKLSADELRAAPDPDPAYANADAYTALAQASYPHTLPYDRALDEVRKYLNQSGIALWQLRHALLPLNNATLTQQASVAGERFQIDAVERELITTASPGNAVVWNTHKPTTDLVNVSTFLRAASITYEQLLELLDVAWVQSGAELGIKGVDDTCDTSNMSFTSPPLDPDLLDRTHRFLRLWRHAGFKMWELGLLLIAQAVGNDSLDENALVSLFTFRLLQDATGLATDQQLAFFQHLDTKSHVDSGSAQTTSLYARVFLNPAIQPPDADLAAAASGTTITDNVLSHHATAIQAALGLSSDDATVLFKLFKLDAANTLTQTNLSLLYRVTKLTQAVKLSLMDLLTVLPLTSAGSTDLVLAFNAVFASPAASLAFIREVLAIQQSGFTLDEIVYLLTPPPWTTKTGIVDASIEVLLGSVRKAIITSSGSVNDSVVTTLATQLGLANDVTAELVQKLQVPNTGTLLAVLTDPSLTTQTGGNFTVINRANFPKQFLAIQSLDKVGIVVKRLHLVLADFAWLLANASVYSGLDLQQLPVENSQASLTLAPLLTTVLIVKLARLWTAAPPQSAVKTLYELIDGVSSGTIADANAAQAALATITGWAQAEVRSLATSLTLSFKGDYTKPASYDALRVLEAMIAKTANKASGDQLIAWGAPRPDALAAASALAVLQARYSHGDWMKLAPSLNDPMRERRSAALQAYLTSQRDNTGALIYGDSNALFDHFLIDVQMSSCEVTTRAVQAYTAVQNFVERCRMGLEGPTAKNPIGVVADPSKDDAWDQWQWMKRYRVWQANREVFLYPENYLIEPQRLNRSEIFQKLEQEVHQNENTLDYLETVALNYIDRLDEIAHLHVTGTCSDPVTGALHVIARTPAEPPRFYHRSLVDGVWTGWQQIPLDIKAQQVVPAVYRRRLYLFWPDVKLANEPKQQLPKAQASSSPPSQDVARYVSIGLNFSVFRNGAWVPTQMSKGKLFDVPPLDSEKVSDTKAVESLYTIKVQTPTANNGANLFIDVFRLGKWLVMPKNEISVDIVGVDPTITMHLGRMVFDGRFNDIELRDPFWVKINGKPVILINYAQNNYGPNAAALVRLAAIEADPDLVGEPGLVSQAGALVTAPSTSASMALTFTSVTALEQNVGALLNTAPAPFSIVGPSTDLSFDPTSYFFYQDSRRCYFVEGVRYYQWGSAWLPIAPSNAGTAPFELRHRFHRFYHPYTRLFWHQLAAGGFPSLYDRNLQLNPDTIDPKADAFSFKRQYKPVSPRVSYGEDNEIVDFSPDAAFSVYNWELFFHVPLYIAERLSQDQRFEDAIKWFHFIFDPTRVGSDPVPQRFWITKPLNTLTTPQILQERINELLQLVNQGDPGAVAQVARWRKNPFNPFLLADLRPAAYMKRVVMSYLDNLIAWADNLFRTDSREALNEATLLYIMAAEILGPQPVAITPPQRTDESFNDLATKLDDFADKVVEIENVMGGSGGGGGGGGGNMPPPHAFYFKIPPNEKMLGYWRTVADRLYKLRYCQNIMGVTRLLALFDAPIDPALLIKAQAAGVNVGGMFNVMTGPPPVYRFTALYPQALDFVNAVRAYGSALLTAIEKSDAAKLAMLQQTTQLQLLRDADQIFEWQVQQAEHAIDALNQARDLAKSKYNFNISQTFANPAEYTGAVLLAAAKVIKSIAAATQMTSGVIHIAPQVITGIGGIGGTPFATISEGADNVGKSSHRAGLSLNNLADITEVAAGLATTLGAWQHRKDNWDQAAAEAQIQIQQTEAQLEGAKLALQIAQQNQANHQEQVNNLQKQIDFLTTKFTSQELYDWMVGQLANTYFQSYLLAYDLCTDVERCYRYELGISSSFIQLTYWNTLTNGLLAGEALNHDLRRMQSSYLQQNSRRFEISRYISLAALDPNALVTLLENGACDFDIPESLFDNDYPGHYQRHLLRVSLTVVYPNPGKFDNVKSTLTLVSNSVRVSTDVSSGYPRDMHGDSRFIDNYAVNQQKIILGNAQDDPGLFLTAIKDNLGDPRYLPFEGAGAISKWHLELPAANNEIDLTAIGDVIIHLYYTALYGGDTFKQTVEADNATNLPTQGVKVFSALNDFGAPAPTAANPFPISPWQSFLAIPAGGGEQQLVLSISPSKFPAWTRGKTITVTGLTVFVVSWSGGSWVLEPQAPLPTTDVSLTPVSGAPTVASGTVAVPTNTALGTWTFQLRKSAATNFHSLSKNDIGDVVLLISFQAS